MKNKINCVNWTEYEGLNGAVMFCSAGAYGKKLKETEAVECGCTMEQRKQCLKIMESNMGYGLVPEILKEEVVVVDAPLAVVA